MFSATYERSNEDLFNAIYATAADVTQTIYRNGNTPTGILRHETAYFTLNESRIELTDWLKNIVNMALSIVPLKLKEQPISDYY